jgi:hypothetical protein
MDASGGQLFINSLQKRAKKTNFFAAPILVSRWVASWVAGATRFLKKVGQKLLICRAITNQFICFVSQIQEFPRTSQPATRNENRKHHYPSFLLLLHFSFKNDKME